VNSGKAVISQEDFAIVPFDVYPRDTERVREKIWYRCTLNRDSQSEETITAKVAASTSRKTIEYMKEAVSYVLSAPQTIARKILFNPQTFVANLFFSQVFGFPTSHSQREIEKSTHPAVLVASYLENLDCWLDAYFDGLKTVDSWQRFYVHLVRKLVFLTSGGLKKEDCIDANLIVMPRVRDIFHVCRLLYQAIGKLRIAVPDGQHRMAAMIELLSGWQITVESRKIPPKAFVREEQYLQEEDAEITLSKFERTLKTLCGKVMVRVLTPETNALESESEVYSHIREISQSKHKPRVLADV
jgi:hypothetical protein